MYIRWKEMSSGLLVTTGIMATWIQAAPAVLPLFACATHTAFCTTVDDLVLGLFLTEKLFLVCGWVCGRNPVFSMFFPEFH
jgi:hypothetical protein